jgi:hypothetical protein
MVASEKAANKQRICFEREMEDILEGGKRTPGVFM